MAVTKPSDLLDIQIIGMLANEKLYSKSSLLSSGFVANANETARRGGSGTTISFPAFTTNDTDFETNPKDGNTVTSGSFAMTFRDETIIPVICPVDIEDSALIYMAEVANLEQYIADHVAKQARLEVQGSLITEAQTTSKTFYGAPSSVATQASWDDLVKAKTTNWGEYAFDETDLFVCHSNVAHDLIKSPEAKERGVYGANTTVTSGKIIEGFAGCSILPLDSITASNGVYPNLILKRDALMLWSGIAMKYNEQMKAHTTVWQLDWWFEYAVHLSTQAPVGAIKYFTTSTLD